MPKLALTIDQQISLLKSRNMSFRSSEEAFHALGNISYYRLKGYWWEMQDDIEFHHFADESYFEDAIDLYKFDKEFRLIIFGAIEQIEIALRAKLSYHFSLKYGPNWYLDPQHFDKPKEHASLLGRFYGDMSRSSDEFIIKHFHNHPAEHLESWKSLEIMTLGSLSKLYQNLKHQSNEKNLIAKEFGLINEKHLVSWLLAITVVRNIIAHHGRLWNRVIINKYDWPAKTISPILNYVPDNFQRRKIFPLLSALLYLNNHVNSTSTLQGELQILLAKYPEVPKYKMGFPLSWENEPIWLSS
jgi:abortive infection bacteriophage resistance protein